MTRATRIPLIARGHAEIPLTARANSANLSRRSPNFAIITNRHAANLIEVAALSFPRPRKDPSVQSQLRN